MITADQLRAMSKLSSPRQFADATDNGYSLYAHVKSLLEFPYILVACNERTLPEIEYDLTDKGYTVSHEPHNILKVTL